MECRVVLRHCEENLLRFAVPRFVEVIPKNNRAETIDRQQVVNQTSNR